MVKITLAEDPGSVPSTHMTACNSVTRVPSDPMSSFGLSRYQAHMQYMYIHVDKAIIHTKNR